LPLFLAGPCKMIRTDGTKVTHIYHPSWKIESSVICDIEDGLLDCFLVPYVLRQRPSTPSMSQTSLEKMMRQRLMHLPEFNNYKAPCSIFALAP
jgi:hypothetical protein